MARPCLVRYLKGDDRLPSVCPGRARCRTNRTRNNRLPSAEGPSRSLCTRRRTDTNQRASSLLSGIRTRDRSVWISAGFPWGPLQALISSNDGVSAPVVTEKARSSRSIVDPTCSCDTGGGIERGGILLEEWDMSGLTAGAFRGQKLSCPCHP